LKKLKVTGFKGYIQDSGSVLASDFMEYAKDILESDMFRELDNCEHHVDISRQQHSVNVAYIAFGAARVLGLDEMSTLRAGLLHDLFFYNYRESGLGMKHSYVHPEQALANASLLCELNEKEREIIKYHMWPVCSGTPRYLETYLISMVDKYCATIEAANYSVRLMKSFYRRHVKA
jgi:uncharacterized protein